MIRISDAELQVMKVVWKRKETTSSEIIEDLKGFKWKTNTIRTLIKRLKSKGAIEIAGRKGKGYTYRATVDEDTYREERLRDLLKRLYNNSLEELILNYCEADRSAAIELRDTLKEVIKEREEKEKKEKEQNKNKK